MKMEVALPTDVNTAKRPVRILASYVMDADNVSENYSDELHSLASLAGRAIVAAAADVQVVFVDSSNPDSSVDRSLTKVDGVLMLGGMDVDPRRYTDDAAEIAKAEASSPVADAFEIDLIRTASDRGLPVLGICRGAQIMNVAFGGTLITDLGKGTIHTIAGATDFCDHPVLIQAGSRLSSIYPAETVDVRSAHHQAVDQIAPGLRVTAAAPDGIIEAVEAADDRWLLGVQWHPEDEGGNREHLDLLAQALIAEARKIHENRLNG